MAGNTVLVSVLADTKPFGKSMDSIGGKTSGLTRGLKTLGALGATAFAAGAVGLGKAVGMASKLEQSLGGVESVFKQFSGQTKKFASEAANNVGLSANSYNELATIIGTTLKNSGTPLDQLATKTDKLIGVSSDLAATFGGEVTEASNAMSSALRGEFEPLRRYGVSLNQADINAKAMAMSGKANAAQLTKQEKALATQALILEQSADAAGAFARESNTLAGKQERLRANVENVATKIGTAFLPIVTLAVGVVGDLVSKLAESEGLQNFMDTVATWGETLNDALTRADGAGGGLIGTLLDMFTGLSPVAAIIQAIVPLLPQFQQGFEDIGNALTDSGLIESIQDLGAELAGALLDAFLAIAPQLPTVVEGFVALLDAVIPLIPVLVEILTPILGLIEPLAEFIAVLFTPTGETTEAQTATEGLTGVLQFLGGIIAWVTSLFGGMLTILTGFIKFVTGEFTLEEMVQEILNIEGPFGDAARWVFGLMVDVRKFAIDAGQNIARFASAVRTKITEVGTFFTRLPGKILAAVAGFGSLLYNSGKNIVQGLINGVNGLAQRAINSVLNIGTSMVNGVKSFLGIKSPSRVFMAIGKNVVQGLIGGLSNTGGITAAMTRVSNAVTNGFGVDLSAAGGGPTVAFAGAAGGRQYNVTVQAVAPNAEVGRAVVDAIDEYERLNGKRP